MYIYKLYPDKDLFSVHASLEELREISAALQKRSDDFQTSFGGAVNCAALHNMADCINRTLSFHDRIVSPPPSPAQTTWNAAIERSKMRTTDRAKFTAELEELQTTLDSISMRLAELKGT